MAITVTGVNDPKAVKRWATSLAVDYARALYFRRFTGRTENSIVQEKIELASDAGDKISFDLSMRLRNEPVFGDDRAEGREESLRFYTDEIMIDQMRKPVSAGGRMTRKRTIHDYRRIARDRTAEYCAEWMDELHFAYLSGGVGINEDATVKVEFAGNPFQAPDAEHILYGGSATSKATVTTADGMSVDLIERACTHAKMINALNPDSVSMRPVRIDSAEHFVLLMSPFQEYDLRTSAGDHNWPAIQRAAAGAEGRNNPIFRGGLGMVSNVVLHSHSNIRRFNDYGAGGDVPAARALFMGRQAACCAYGTPGRQRMTWVEKMKDFDNEVTIACGMIAGVKKTRFNGKDFGVLSLDTYARNPNAA